MAWTSPSQIRSLFLLGISLKLTGSFPYGNPFEFCKAWRASYFLIYTIRGWQANIDQCRQLVKTCQLSPRRLIKASSFWGRQHHEGINLIGASAFKEPFEASHCQWWMFMGADGRKSSRQPVSSLSPMLSMQNIGLLRITSYTYFHPTSVALYSIISSILNWWICGVLSNYLFGPREAGKSLVNPSSRDAFNTQNTCHPFVGPVFDEGVASSSAHFSFLYI